MEERLKKEDKRKFYIYCILERDTKAVRERERERERDRERERQTERETDRERETERETERERMGVCAWWAE